MAVRAPRGVRFRSCHASKARSESYPTWQSRRMIQKPVLGAAGHVGYSARRSRICSQGEPTMTFFLFTVLSMAAAENDTAAVKELGSKPIEPLAKAFSIDKAVHSLDAVSLHWIAQHKCASCHTTYPYLMTRPT